MKSYNLFDGDLAPRGRERPLHHAAEVVRLGHAEVREIGVGLTRRCAVEETHGGLLTVTPLPLVANASSE